MSFFKDLTARALDNIIDGRIAQNNRTSRNTVHKKSPQQSPKEGVPPNSEGSDGDIVVRGTDEGIKLYGKYRGAWYGAGAKKIVKENAIAKLSDSNVSDSDLLEKLNEIIDRINR